MTDMRGRLALISLTILVIVALAGVTLLLGSTELILPSMFLIVQLILLFVPVWFRVARKQFDILELGPLYAFLYSLYSLPLAIRLLYVEGTLDVKTVTLYLFVTSVGLGCFWLGYSSRFTHRIVQKLPLLAPAVNGLIPFAAAGYAVLGLFLLYLLFDKIGGLVQYLAIGYGAEIYLKLQGKGYLAVGQDLLILAVGLLWYYNLKARSRLGWVIFVALAIPFILLRLAMGDRGSLLTLFVIMLAGYHYLTKRFSFRRSLLLLILGYTVAVCLSIGRYSLKREGLASVPGYVAENLRPEYFSPLNVAEFNAPANALYELLERRERLTYRLGESYLIFFENLMPQAITPVQAEPLSDWYVRELHPELWQIGGGLGFFCVAEAFLNFWFFGPVVQFFFYGLILGTIYAYFRRQTYHPAVVFVYAVGLPWMFSFIRIDFATALRGSLSRGVIPAAMAALFIVRWRLMPGTPEAGANPERRVFEREEPHLTDQQPARVIPGRGESKLPA